MKTQNLKKFIPFIVVLFTLISTAIIFANRGFKYSEFEPYYQVAFNSEFINEENLNKVSQLSSLMEIDRSEGIALFQHISVEQLEQNLKSLNSEDQSTNYIIQEISPSTTKRDEVLSLFSGIVVVTLFFIGFSFVAKSRFFKWKTIDYVKYYWFYIRNLIISTIILFGLISSLSLVYKINDFVLISMLFLIILKTSIFWFRLLNEDLDQMKLSFIENFKDDYRKIFSATFIICVLAAAGFGVKSVIPLVLIVVSVIISALVDYFLLSFEVKKLNKTVFVTAESTKQESKPNKSSRYINRPGKKKVRSNK
jgi:hypothetical protein